MTEDLRPPVGVLPLVDAVYLDVCCRNGRTRFGFSVIKTRVEVDSVKFDRPESVSLEAADQLRAEILDAVQRLAEMHGIGHSRQDFTEHPIRFLLVERYYLIYRFDATVVKILRVIHNAKDVAAILALEPPN